VNIVSDSTVNEFESGIDCGEPFQGAEFPVAFRVGEEIVEMEAGA
jgi:hypothetical protein